MTDTKLIHVVDDEESVRQSLNFLLRTAGYAVKRWQDGASFLKGASNAAQACVLLDIHMPGLDGIQVQELMIRKGFDLPVIMLTGHGDIELAVHAMKAGAFDFIQKPFDRARLLDSVSNAFREVADRDAHLERTQWACAQLGKLTDRECEVLDGLACGYPNKTIAFDLGISARTVEVYRANVMEKLCVNSFADALRVAFAAGLGSGREWRLGHAADGKAGTACAGTGPSAPGYSQWRTQRGDAMP